MKTVLTPDFCLDEHGFLWAQMWITEDVLKHIHLIWRGPVGNIAGQQISSYHSIHQRLREHLQTQLPMPFPEQTDWAHHPAFPIQPSPFQQRVWQRCSQIPTGESLTYAQLAETIDHPRAARAVGNALNRNPWPILIPCHRVQAANHPGGYAWGPEIKQFLHRAERLG